MRGTIGFSVSIATQLTITVVHLTILTLSESVSIQCPSNSDTTDYESVSILMTYSGNTTRQCFNLIIYDDSIFESEEGFFLVTVPTETAMSYVGVLNASVFIEDDDGKLVHYVSLVVRLKN